MNSLTLKFYSMVLYCLAVLIKFSDTDDDRKEAILDNILDLTSEINRVTGKLP